MKEKPAFNDLLKQAAELLPDGRSLRADAESKLRPLLLAQLAKLDLVTREEFDRQQQQLEQLQQQAETLAAQLQALEASEENP